MSNGFMKSEIDTTASCGHLVTYAVYVLSNQRCQLSHCLETLILRLKIKTRLSYFILILDKSLSILD
jgi:hypothetical protein